MATSSPLATTYSLRLTKEQRSFINQMLPRGYSFQTTTQSKHKPAISRSSTVKKFAVPKEETVEEKESHTEQKRRKTKPLQEPEKPQKRNSLGKKEEINKRVQIVKKLKKHQASWPFRNPVNPKTLDIPNYFQVILTPMDLHTIEERIKEDAYEHHSQIERDIAQMFLNSYKFNPKNDAYFLATSKLQNYYSDLLKEIQETPAKKELPDRQKKKEDSHQNGIIHETIVTGSEKNNEFIQLQKDLNALLKKSGEFCNLQKIGRQKPSYFSTKNDYTLTLKEKKELAQEIRKLDPRHLQRIYTIIKNSHSTHGISSHTIDQNKNQTENGGDEVYGVDLQKLEQKTLRQLNNYIKLQKNNANYEVDLSIEDSKQVKMISQ